MAEAAHISQTVLIRGQAIEKATRSRAQMLERDRRENPQPHYEIGELVTLRIPKKNRTATQNRRLVCRVLSQCNPGQSELQTAYGVLNNTYPAGELDRTTGTLAFSIQVSDPEKKITLNFAAKQERTMAATQSSSSNTLAEDASISVSSMGETSTISRYRMTDTIVVRQERGGILSPPQPQSMVSLTAALVDLEADGSYLLSYVIFVVNTFRCGLGTKPRAGYI